MTEQELIQENEKLTARLKKAVEVFNEQKATIARQTEEIESLKAKAAEAENKDSEFFDQVNEIETLKTDLNEAKENYLTADKKVQELTVRLEKATEEYKKLKEELKKTTGRLATEEQRSQHLTEKLDAIKNLLNN